MSADTTNCEQPCSGDTRPVNEDFERDALDYIESFYGNCTIFDDFGAE